MIFNANILAHRLYISRIVPLVLEEVFRFVHFQGYNILHLKKNTNSIFM